MNGTLIANDKAKATRAIDFFEGDLIEETALEDLIRAAVANNICER
jgi:hypothetical protein